MAYSKQSWSNDPSAASPISAERLNHIEEGIYQNSSELAAKAKQSDLDIANTNISTNTTNISTHTTQITALSNGAPKAVSTVAEMIDNTKNYVYTGVEEGYTAGNWYYRNGTAWVSGGVYQATSIGDGGVTKNKYADDSIYLSKVSYLETDSNNLLEILDKNTVYNGITIIANRDTGYISISGTATSALFGYSFSMPISLSNGIAYTLGVDVEFVSLSGECVVGMMDATQGNIGGFGITSSGTKTGAITLSADKPNSTMYIYISEGTTINIKILPILVIGSSITDYVSKYRKTMNTEFDGTKKILSGSNDDKTLKNVITIKNSLITNKTQIVAGTVTIDTLVGTVVFAGAHFSYGQGYVKLNTTFNFTYNPDFINYFLYDFETQSIYAITDVSGVNTFGHVKGLNQMLLFGLYHNQITDCFTTFGFTINGKSPINNTVNHFNDMYFKSFKMNFMGDSITYGTGATKTFCQIISEDLDCTVNNYGVWGSALSHSTSGVLSFYERYQSMSDDADIIAVMGGTNDYWQNLPLGIYGDATATTIYGALDTLMIGLKTKYVGKFLYFVTPPHGYISGDFTEDTRSQCGSFNDICDAIKKVARRYGIPVLDVYSESGLCARINANNNEYYSDGVHLNDNGHLVMAEMHKNFIKNNYNKY
jgi:lysophospholipase L1-like esterase